VFIGSGGSARVYRARRKADGQVVAVKVPRTADEETGQSFLREIRAWEELEHPNILPVLAVNILPVPFVEMPCISPSLAQKDLPLDPRSAAAIALGIADGLVYAHRRGFVHRDLKPENILLGNGSEPRIADWGTSRKQAGRITEASGFSLSYAAPEQVSRARYGQTGPWTDIWQLGVILYELVTGTLPFPDGDPAVLGKAILNDRFDPPSLRNAGAAPLDGIILRCLEKEPSARFGSMEELRDALKRFLSTASGGTD
jgi:serine/threonine protein kinase